MRRKSKRFRRKRSKKSRKFRNAGMVAAGIISGSLIFLGLSVSGIAYFRNRSGSVMAVNTEMQSQSNDQANIDAEERVEERRDANLHEWLRLAAAEGDPELASEAAAISRATSAARKATKRPHEGSFEDFIEQHSVIDGYGNPIPGASFDKPVNQSYGGQDQGPGRQLSAAKEIAKITAAARAAREAAEEASEPVNQYYGYGGQDPGPGPQLSAAKEIAKITAAARAAREAAAEEAPSSRDALLGAWAAPKPSNYYTSVGLKDPRTRQPSFRFKTNKRSKKRKNRRKRSRKHLWFPVLRDERS